MVLDGLREKASDGHRYLAGMENVLGAFLLLPAATHTWLHSCAVTVGRDLRVTAAAPKLSGHGDSVAALLRAGVHRTIDACNS